MTKKTVIPVCVCTHSLSWHGVKKKGACFAQAGLCPCSKYVPVHTIEKKRGKNNER